MSYEIEIYRSGHGRAGVPSQGASELVVDVPTDEEAQAVVEQALFHPHSEYANLRRVSGDEIMVQRDDGKTVFGAIWTPENEWYVYHRWGAHTRPTKRRKRA